MKRICWAAYFSKFPYLSLCRYIKLVKFNVSAAVLNDSHFHRISCALFRNSKETNNKDIELFTTNHDNCSSAYFNSKLSRRQLTIRSNELLLIFHLLHCIATRLDYDRGKVRPRHQPNNCSLT